MEQAQSVTLCRYGAADLLGWAIVILFFVGVRIALSAVRVPHDGLHNGLPQGARLSSARRCAKTSGA